MFTHLTDFKYVRKTKEAIGFYLAYLLLYTVIGSVVGLWFGGIFGGGFNGGARAGTYSSILTTLVLLYLVLKNKKLYKHFIYLLISILTIGLSYFGGGLLVLIPIAFLTTRKILVEK